jgi:hypothetical protein
MADTETVGTRVRAYVSDAPVVGAMAVGAASYVLGYVVTYLLVLVDSGLDAKTTTQTVLAETRTFEQAQLAGFPQPEPTTMEFVGWVFYNAHFVDTVLTPQVSGRAGQGGAQTQSAPEALNVLTSASTQLPSIVYQLVPVVLLAAGGYALARIADLDVSRSLVRIGLGIPTTYVPLGLFGTLVFRTAATAQQDGIQLTVSASPSIGGVIVVAVLSTLFGIAGLSLGAQQE